MGEGGEGCTELPQIGTLCDRIISEGGNMVSKYQCNHPVDAVVTMIQ